MSRERRSGQTSVDLLIFDLDGTLIESKWDIAHAVNLTLAHFGLPVRTQEQIFDFGQDGVTGLLRRAVGVENRGRCDEALRVFRGHYLTHCLDRTRFYPGIEAVLTRFVDKHKAVATNKAFEQTTKILEGLGPHHFAYVIGGDSGYGLKPAPDMIWEILRALNIKMDRAILIGDSTNDINAGHNAGIKVCAVGYGTGNRERMAACRPDWFIEKPEELLELFR